MGDTTDPQTPLPDEAQIEDEYFPQPTWKRESAEREPESGEVEARKILLSGGYGLWLDDGDRIRA